MKKGCNVKTYTLYALAVVLVSWVSWAQSPVKQTPPAVLEPKDAARTIHRDIADSSPIAAARISVVPNPVKAGANVKIRIVLENRSDRDISLPPISRTAPAIVFDARDSEGAFCPKRSTDARCTISVPASSLPIRFQGLELEGQRQRQRQFRLTIKSRRLHY